MNIFQMWLVSSVYNNIFMCLQKQYSIYKCRYLDINKYFYIYYIVVNQNYIVYYINLYYKSILCTVCIFVNVPIWTLFILNILLNICILCFIIKLKLHAYNNSFYSMYKRNIRFCIMWYTFVILIFLYL